MNVDPSQFFKIRSTKELDMLLSNCALVNDLWRLTRNVSSINGISCPNFHLHSVYLSFSSGIHAVKINVNKTSKCVFYLFPRRLECFLKFSLYQNRNLFKEMLSNKHPFLSI